MWITSIGKCNKWSKEAVLVSQFLRVTEVRKILGHSDQSNKSDDA